MKHLLFITAVLYLFSCDLSQDSSENGEDGEALPTHASTIQTASQMVDGTDFIVLEEPRPFRVFSGASEINFIFWIPEDSAESKGRISRGEIFIFSRNPLIKELRDEQSEGCVAGISALAGHTMDGMTALLSNDISNSQFYECAPPEGTLGLLGYNRITLYSLAPGDYYWFVLEYNDDLAVTHSSEVRSFTIE